ncbi:MAG: 50S ribosomal protein L15 [Candidatus Improbicoccus devescovinae]|nr:MAG: 50S ribosomal protein L15 [Candidatus Improbicoccus devescovinae]
MGDLELKPAAGSKFRVRRIGRGHGSGHGKTAGKGHKGQKARSGGKIGRGFEGGQLPLKKRIPKRGFTNSFALKVGIVDVRKLEIFEANSSVNVQKLREFNLIKGRFDKIKIIGKSRISKILNIKVDACSAAARASIESASGTILCGATEVV